MTFIPLVSFDRVIGKFMLYTRRRTRRRPTSCSSPRVIAAQIAFAVERTTAEERARRSEERLRFALHAASMGTWDWTLPGTRCAGRQSRSDHGLPPGTFDGNFSELRA